MTSIAVSQGQAGEFAVLQDYGLLPEGETYVCDTVASRGMLVFQSAEGVCSIVSGNMASTTMLLGFIEQQVVADNNASIQFGYTAQQKTGSYAGEKVAIWKAGRVFVTAVSGTVTAGTTVYPHDSGKVGGTQVGAAPAVGKCVKGNGGVAGDPIEVEFFLIGRPGM